MISVQERVFGGAAIKLANSPYWPFSNELPLISASETLFPINGFYDTYSGIDGSEPQGCIEGLSYVSAGATLLVPHIRRSDRARISALAEKGFRFLPATGDAELVAEPGTTFEHLRSVVGSKRYRDLQRLHRQAEKMSLINIAPADLIRDKALFRHVVEVCNAQEAKYNNRTVVYGERFIRALADYGDVIPITMHLRLYDNDVMQVIYTRRLADTLVLMASATSASARDLGYNLYATMMMDALDMKESEKWLSLNIGRGDIATKRSYGADVYHEHVHAIRVDQAEHLHELNMSCICVDLEEISRD